MNQPTAEMYLAKAAKLMAERGKEYDTADQKERSADKVATAFSAITGHNLAGSEVWLLLQILKDVRQWTNPRYHQDSAEDCIAYAALKAEAIAQQYKTYRDFELTTGVTPKKIGAAIDSAVQVIKDLKKENLKLKQAIADTLEENRHLADGDNCTLIRLKRALQ
ncbi:MAG: DUF6378 domain-containing protein [Thiomicrospira sp.]|jgi:hypothetical protein|nr:DUF6378 domain-containing protein [Thiomicrospira sp.]